ncbi:tetratricopeptide repeat protein [Polaromonas jejuensis]|uniref:Tetratricopeptide repeat protein n=2 Tax=Polaromonas jejuensis TaxID=457502 RepID=A0ABW0QC70_9BURK
MQAVLLLVCGNKSGALRRFERMLQLRPTDRYALASRAHLQVALNQPEDAIACLQQLTGLAPDGPQAAAAWFNLGYVLQQAGRHDDAGPAFQRALVLDPSMDRAWYGLALVLMQQRQFREAVEALKKNTALQPMSPYGWYRLAQARLALGQTDKARGVIEHLRQFEPGVAALLERENGLGQVDSSDEAVVRAVPDAAH